MLRSMHRRQSRQRPRRPALSPSRAADFKQCPLLYRFRAIDRLPEPPSPAQLRGSVVHAALEQLYGLPAPERGKETALALVAPSWELVIAEEPEFARAVRPRTARAAADRGARRCWRATTASKIRPDSIRRAVNSASRSNSTTARCCAASSTASMSRPRVSCGWWTTRPVRRRRRHADVAEAKAMFQMKFYAVALLRSRGVLPTRLRLIYLADGQLLDYTPDLDELLRFEKTLMAIWRAIQSAGATGDFRPNPSGCAIGAAIRRTARRSAAPRRPTRGGRSSRVSRPHEQSITSGSARRRRPALRVHRPHP